VSDYYNIRQFAGKKGPATYKPATTGNNQPGAGRKGSYSNRGNGKPATKKRIVMVDKKVKRISNKIMRMKKKIPGPAAHSTYGGNAA